MPAIITTEVWKQILSNKSLMKRTYIDTLLAFYLEAQHESTCKNLGEKYNKDPNYFNISISNLAKKVQQHLDLPKPIGPSNDSKLWPLVMTGRNVNNLFAWTLRDELVEAMEDLNFVESNINDMEIILNNNQARYTWIPAFKAISEWLVDFEDKQEVLVEVLKQLGVANSLSDRDTEGGKLYPLENIDPFTFFSNLTKYGESKRLQLIRDLITTQNLQAPLPMDVEGLPAALPQNVSLFPYAYNRTDDMIPSLWRLFHQAMANDIKPDTFDSVLDIPRVGFAKLTQNLFYINPSKYLQVDSITKPWLTSRGVQLPDENYLSYQSFLSEVKDKFDIPFYQISDEAWVESQELKGNVDTGDVTQTEYDVTFSTEPKIPLNRILYGPPGTGKTYRTTELAVECVEPEWYAKLLLDDLPESHKRQLIKQKYDDLISKDRIAFTTFHQSFAYEDFVEGIRPTVSKETDDQSSISYDVIPGVFKNLCTLASPNAKEQTGSTQSVDIDGKNIWKLSLGNTLEYEGEEVYNDCLKNNYVLLGWGDDIDFTGCDARKEIISKVEKARNISLADDPYNYLITAVNTFKNIIKEGDLIIISDGNHKFRAIAEVTGDYKFLENQVSTGYQQSRPVKWLRIYDNSLPKEKLFEKSLSQMSLYNLKDGTINRDKLKELLTVESNTDSLEKPHLLIIDEINRGNISRIFGELITLLEPDKRKGGSDAREVTLPYSKDKFSVPSNLYVIGTMNTADKSLAQIDFALRRRFEFIETLPDPSLLSDIEVFGIQLSDLLTIMNQRIEVLLDREHTIGHAYFWSLKDLDSDNAIEYELANVFKNRIIPLLQEYFFSDWERIGWVLNDPAKKPEHRFIQVGNLQPNITELFHSSVTDQVMDRRYRINKNAFNLPEAYTGIISVDTQAD